MMPEESIDFSLSANLVDVDEGLPLQIQDRLKA